MRVVCLRSQEGSFETRILKRMAEPAFISPSDLIESQDAPLLLFGKWYDEGFLDGLRWLSEIAFRLRFPSILFPPFEEYQISRILRLQVSLEAKGIDREKLKVMDEEVLMHLGKTGLRVQSDFAFIGPAGNSLIVENESNMPVVVALRQKNTSTPMLLCGARALSSSGLSDDGDRMALFRALVTWANAHRKIHEEKVSPTGEDVVLTDEKLHSICVILAGAGVNRTKEIISLADSILGIGLTSEEVKLGIEYLADKGLLTIQGDSVSIEQGPLTSFIQDTGLWPHVRMLKSDFLKKEQR